MLFIWGNRGQVQKTAEWSSFMPLFHVPDGSKHRFFRGSSCYFIWENSGQVQKTEERSNFMLFLHVPMALNRNAFVHQNVALLEGTVGKFKRRQNDPVSCSCFMFQMAPNTNPVEQDLFVFCHDRNRQTDRWIFVQILVLNMFRVFEKCKEVTSFPY